MIVGHCHWVSLLQNLNLFHLFVAAGPFFCFLLLFFWQPLWSEQPQPKCTPNTQNNRKDRRFLCSHWFGLNEECDYSHLGMLLIIWLKPRFFSFPKLICYCCQHVLEDIFWYFSVCICHIYWRDSGNTVSGKPMDSFRKPVLHVFMTKTFKVESCSYTKSLRILFILDTVRYSEPNNILILD